jgi:hypothetical protein
VARGKNFKRGAPGDKGGHNPINSRMPEEYVCVVGSCSNTYNGYMYAEADATGHSHWVPCTNPRTLEGVPRYIKGPPGQKAVTHDVYWANFLDPAIKLYANKMVQPKPGDVVTIMVFMKGYLQRQSFDWDASPYNLKLHRDSPWVAGNPEYDQSGKGGAPPAPQAGSSSNAQIASLTPNSKTAGDAGFTLTVNGSGFLPGAKVSWDGSTLSTVFVGATLLTAVVPASAISRRGTANVRVVNPVEVGSEAKPFFIKPSATDTDPEDVINHDILMRTTSANSDGIIKQPRQFNDEVDYIHDIPRRIVFGRSLGGSPQLPDVLVKLLVFNDPSSLSDYLLTGSISAQYWKHLMDTVDEDDMGNATAVSDKGSYFDAVLNFSSRQWSARWKKLLKSAGVEPPSINRSKIKIKRFDYIGHSDDEAFYLQYGWHNAKGVLPWEDVRFENAQLTAALPKKNLTTDAYAHLWGCHQGGGTGPALVGAFKEVTACEGSTFFDHILDSDSAMPVPEKGSDWKTLKRK